MEEHPTKIDWSFRAMDELTDIRDYLAAQTYDEKADAFIDALLAEVQKLEKNPATFPFCRNQMLQEKGYRCINFKNYIIVYFIESDHVQIVAVMHARRNPKDFDEIAK